MGKQVSTYVQLRAISHSLYILQIRNWLKIFPREQLLIILSEDFYSDTSSAMNRVTRHLHIPSIDWTNLVQDKYNVGINDKRTGFVKEKGGIIPIHVIDPHIRKMLEEFFDPFNKELGKFLGLDDSPWPY